MSNILAHQILPTSVEDVKKIPTGGCDVTRISQNTPLADVLGRRTTRNSAIPLPSLPRLDEVGLHHDTGTRTLWQFMQPAGRPSFTPGLLRDMTTALNIVEQSHCAEGDPEEVIRYLVLASKMPGIFNLGGDLPHFMELIAAGDRARLQWYARVCAEGQHRRAVSLGLPICTIAVVQGDALGDGFEAALAHDVIIAERSASFGLPEVLFGMFPGMGAYSFLARRLDPIRAERIILSGKIYKAEELHAMGVVDELAEDGEGLQAARDFIRSFDRARGSRQALLQARKMLQPVTLKELVDIADLWVDAALQLGPAELRKMSHLAKAQDRRWQRIAAAVTAIGHRMSEAS
ncbi:MAG: crotonase/enoyl-CoA hydratase family protein [Defluviicoccus sp.]